jgi:streptogramin lyase
MQRSNRILVAIVLGMWTLGTASASAGPHLTVYMSTGLNDRIDQVTPPGPRSSFAALPFANPEGLVFDAFGNLFVAGAVDVSKITQGGVVSKFATLPFGAGGYGIAIDSAGNLFVADSALSEISKVTAGGVVSHFASLPGLNPTGLTFDAQGNLFVSANGSIKRVSPDGSSVSTYATLPPGFNNNYGLAFDAAGNLYSADATRSTILKIAPGGSSISNFGSLTAGGLGLTFDDGGNLYVAEYSANRIEMIKPDGDTSLFADQLDNPRFIAFRPSALGPVSVPEPSSWVLVATVIAATSSFRRLRASSRHVREGR